MPKLKHPFDSIASDTEAHFLFQLQESEAMDLQTRLNKVAEHLIAEKKTTRRNWKGDMAKAAGCSYQNIRQAAVGEQLSMDHVLLKRIAAWAGVNERFVVDGVGPMLPVDGGSPGEASGQSIPQQRVPLLTGEPPASYSPTSFLSRLPGVTKLQRAPVVAWARLGAELFTDNKEVDAEVNLPVTESVSDRCKWAVSPADYPRFGIRRGYKILIDPVDTAAECIDGEVYLFAGATGTLFMAEFRHLANGGYEAIQDNGLPLDHERHGVTVLAEHVATHKR